MHFAIGRNTFCTGKKYILHREEIYFARGRNTFCTAKKYILHGEDDTSMKSCGLCRWFGAVAPFDANSSFVSLCIMMIMIMICNVTVKLVDLQLFDLFIYDYDHDVFKGEICHFRRQCKFFAIGENFSRNQNIFSQN